MAQADFPPDGGTRLAGADHERKGTGASSRVGERAEAHRAGWSVLAVVVLRPRGVA